MVRSHFHQVAARGYLHLGGEESRALDHLLIVSELGTARPETLGDVQVSIGELATELGRPELAAVHFRAFLQKFPHDPRSFTLRAQLRTLDNDLEPAR